MNIQIHKVLILRTCKHYSAKKKVFANRSDVGVGFKPHRTFSGERSTAQEEAERWRKRQRLGVWPQAMGCWQHEELGRNVFFPASIYTSETDLGPGASGTEKGKISMVLNH